MPNTLVQVVRLCVLAQVKVRSAADLELNKLLFMVAGTGADPGRRSIWYLGSPPKGAKGEKGAKTAGGPGPVRFLPGAEEQPGRPPAGSSGCSRGRRRSRRGTGRRKGRGGVGGSPHRRTGQTSSRSFRISRLLS